MTRPDKMPGDRGLTGYRSGVPPRRRVTAKDVPREQPTLPGLLLGYARCSTDTQDLTAQRQALTCLGVEPAGSMSITG